MTDSIFMNATEELPRNRLKDLVDRPDVSAPEAKKDKATVAPVISTPATPRRKFPFKPILLAGFGLALATGTYFWWDYAKGWESTDDATIVGNTHQIAARISGTVAEVLVEDNEFVHAGQLLVKLDDADEQAALSRANAALAQAKAQQSQAVSQIATAKASQHDNETQLDSARAQLDQAKALTVRAKADFVRSKTLVAQQALSVAEFDATRAAQDSSEASVRSAAAGIESAQARIESAAAQLHAAEAGLAVADAMIQNAEAAKRSAELQIAYTTITASTDGRVGRKSVQTGNRIVLGQPLMAVVEPATWVVANFKETQLARIQPGQVVEVEVDALPGRKLTGRVDSFSPASGATFALLPPDNATGNFTKIVQRVPVKITFDPADLRELGERLSPGLSVVASVNLREAVVPQPSTPAPAAAVASR